MKPYIPAIGVFAITVLYLTLALDAGAGEANIGLFFAPFNSLCGIALCILAFRRHLIWSGILGLLMMAIWPFFTVILLIISEGVLRQLAVGTIVTAYAVIGATCFYRIKQDECAITLEKK
ncbi:MAG: hypothetical protein V4727_14630 [Verrucomicrobiota bacterium]